MTGPGIDSLSESEAGSPLRAHIALAMLFLVGLTNYFDRLALSVLQVPIKNELQFSDSQLGLLLGLAFFIPYTLIAIPIARIADRSNRIFLLAGALVVWSSMTMMVSAADGFLLILFLRMGVAVGEASCLPTSYSLLSDYYSPSTRGRAIAVFAMAFPLGSMLGIGGAGALADIFGWRTTFVILGGLGLVLAPIMLLLLREPPRRRIQGTAGTAQESAEPPPPLMDALRILWDCRELRLAAIGMGFQTYVASTVLSWSIPFYTRVHGLELSKAALVLGILVGFGGACGSFFGGALGDRFGSRNQRWYFWVPAIACALTVPIGLCQFLVSDSTLSFVFAFAAMMMVTSFVPPVYAIAQSLVTPNMRALTSALLVMASALLGGAFGPTVTGFLSDFFLHRFDAGADSVRFALCSGFLFSAGAAGFFARAGFHLKGSPPSDK